MIRIVRWMGVVCAVGVLAGCDDGGGAGGAGGEASSSTGDTTASVSASGSGTTSSATGSSSASGTSSSTGTGGAEASDCTKLLLEGCKQQKLCAPHLFAAQWETDAICEAEAERLCTDLPSPYTDLNPGVKDPAACLAAITGTCADYLAGLDTKPDACRPLGGDKVDEYDGCLLTAQCGPNMVCLENLFEPQHGANCSYFCTPYSDKAIGQLCFGSDNLCNPYQGRLCTFVYDDTKPNKLFDNTKTCQELDYQPLGGGCNETSEQRCGSGLGCGAVGTPNAYKCVNLLSEGQACKASDIVGKDPCDARLGLSCLPKPGDPTKSTCQAPIYVPVNAQCGMVPDGMGVMHLQVCSAYAYCSSTTNLCVRKSDKGEGCVAGGCVTPYECIAGTCSDPALKVDPVCTVAP